MWVCRISYLIIIRISICVIFLITQRYNWIWNVPVSSIFFTRVNGDAYCSKCFSFLYASSIKLYSFRTRFIASCRCCLRFCFKICASRLLCNASCCNSNSCLNVFPKVCDFGARTKSKAVFLERVKNGFDFLFF